MGNYQLGGRDGIWIMLSTYVLRNDVIVVFKNIGSGELVDVELCPFDYIINKKLNFTEWHL